MSNSSDPMDCSPPGSPVPGILQARTLEWVAVSSFPGENARSWGALGEARPGQSSLSAGALRYREEGHLVLGKVGIGEQSLGKLPCGCRAGDEA